MDNLPAFEVYVNPVDNHKTIKANITIKQFFGIGGYSFEAHHFNLIEGPSGLFLSAPSRKYQDNKGETKYYKYIRANEKLHKEWEKIAIEKYMSGKTNKINTNNQNVSWHSQNFKKFKNENNELANQQNDDIPVEQKPEENLEDVPWDVLD